MTDEELLKLAEELRGNWKKGPSVNQRRALTVWIERARKEFRFAWNNRLEDREEWGIVYTHHNNRLLERSNAQAIHKAFKPFLEAEDPDVVEENHSSHWVVGCVKGYAIRPVKDGKITDAFRKWVALNAQRKEHPIDEEGYSKMHHEYALLAIDHECRQHLIGDPPEDWREKVFSWLQGNRPESLECKDGGDVWPSWRHCLQALLHLNLLDPEDTSILRDVDLDGYRLQMWDTEERMGPRAPQYRIAYRLTTPNSTVLFEGDDYGGSPIRAIDSDECLRSLISFLTLKPGDTDSEYFENYTPEQMAFAEGPAEELSIWGMEPEEGESCGYKDWGSDDE